MKRDTLQPYEGRYSLIVKNVKGYKGISQPQVVNGQQFYLFHIKFGCDPNRYKILQDPNFVTEYTFKLKEDDGSGVDIVEVPFSPFDIDRKEVPCSQGVSL